MTVSSSSKEDAGSSKTASLTPETREALLHSILHYLQRFGFNKTLKRLQSEAQIQDDSWKASSVALEDVYDKYIKACSQTEDKVVVESKTKDKKKKKNKHDSTSGGQVEETKSEAVKKPVDDTMSDLEVNESKKKPKEKKKKNKHESASGNEVKETESEAPKKLADDTMNDLEVNESKKKPKDKKKKSKEQEVCAKETADGDLDAVTEEKKSSKKRKRLLSDESGHQSDKLETDQAVEEAPEETEIDEIKAHNNEKSEVNGGENSGPQKSVKKQRIGSAEPKTVNAFQRVKIDQVEFADEKLQDNSYWAKDGAEIGYGAKAQEVLGQVKGRDFRHEKTKKKRGSYRGGQIDLQSHSIKFNYPDED